MNAFAELEQKLSMLNQQQQQQVQVLCTSQPIASINNQEVVVSQVISVFILF